MDARPNSTPWEEAQPFRAVFLRHLFDSEAIEAILRFGAYLFAATLELSTTADVPDGSEVVRDLRAVHEDLTYLSAYLLNVVASTVEAFELRPGDVALARRAEAWSARVEAIAAEIAGALDP